ncbi:MAG: class II aldolase/adducin family protein [Chloroflexi bacterium]|nr:class II aldolase/adducin family protein [Chloroflexota bacterium]MBI2979310.1 class II aldolase/adducin family protein [Chloroflexota bacterium]
MTVNDSSPMKEKLAAAMRIMVNEGLIENSGHISARIPGTDHICILAHIHSEGHVLRDTTAADFHTVNLDGKVVEGERETVGEIYLHTEVYKVRSDVKSVLHAHPPVTIALSIAGTPVTGVYVASGGTVFGNGTPIYDSSTHINRPQDGKKLAQLLGDQMAIMMKGHGAVTVGASIEQACIVTLNLERSAKLMLMAASFGKVRPFLSDKELAESSRRWRGDSEESHQVFWAYWGGRLPK